MNVFKSGAGDATRKDVPIQTFDEKKSSTSALLMLTPCSLKVFIGVFVDYDEDSQDNVDDKLMLMIIYF